MEYFILYWSHLRQLSGQFFDSWHFKDVLPVDTSQHDMVDACSALYSSDSWHDTITLSILYTKNVTHSLFIVSGIKNLSL